MGVVSSVRFTQTLGRIARRSWRRSRRGARPSRSRHSRYFRPLTANAIIAELDARGAKVVISQHPRRAAPRDIDADADAYKRRHLIENLFCKLKEFKRIAMRSHKTDLSFSAMIHLTAAVIHSR
jgi:transposase